VLSAVILKSMWSLSAFALVLPGLVGAQSIKPNTVTGACPAGWFDPDFVDGLGCLLFNDTHHMGWLDAARACQGDHGGSLLKIATPQQKAFVAMELEIVWTNTNSPYWWVGATDINHEGLWVWPDLSPVDRFVWYHNQPDQGLSSNAGYLAARHGGDMYDLPVTDSYAFICQREREEADQPASGSGSHLRRPSNGLSSDQ